MAQRTAKVSGFSEFRDLPRGVYVSRFEDAAEVPALRGQLHHMRRAFEAMQLDGILCIDGRPTVYLRDYPEPITRREANEIQCRCWNQGVATLLLLRDPNRVYVFSAMTPPSNAEDEDTDKHGAFIERMNLAAGALEARRWVEEIASGGYYRRKAGWFQPSKTVDRYLINNLGILCDKLNEGGDATRLRKIHAFIGRILFLCYLVDRDIIRLDDYSFIRRKNIARLVDLFDGYKHDKIATILFENLFPALKREFNGSLFDRDADDARALLGEPQFELLARFLKGEQMDRKQMVLGFWAYDFAVIPVETMSAIYETFLKREDAEEKDRKGAFYTPRNLAEMVVDEALHGVDSPLGKRFLDPACGSGVFLVTIFNRLAEEWRRSNPKKSVADRIPALLDLLCRNIRGVDVNETACRITCLSLYIAFLDQFDPPTLRDLKTEVSLHQRRPLLPPILSPKENGWPEPDTRTIFEGDFFDTAMPIGRDYDFVVGNPPWVSRKHLPEALESWLSSKEKPYEFERAQSPDELTAILFPQKQIAVPFLWKAPVHMKDAGVCCFVLPSALLLNNTDDFQHEWFSRFDADRILHLADYRHFLFENAIRPCFILRFRKSAPTRRRGLEYVTPKVMRLDPRAAAILVSPDDRKWIAWVDVMGAASKGEAARIWKSHLWGTSRDLKFIRMLSELTPLDAHAGEPGKGKRFRKGKGFQPWYQYALDKNPERYGAPKPLPAKPTAASIRELRSEISLLGLDRDTRPLKELLKSERFSKAVRGAVPPAHLAASQKGVRRSPDPSLFEGPVVLVTKGFGNAAFFESGIVFKDPLTGISGDAKDAELMMFLTAYIRSKLGHYFLFHTAGALGTERDEVHVEELLALPFPLPGSDEVSPRAQDIVRDVASRMRAARANVERLYLGSDEWRLTSPGETVADQRRELVDELQREREPLVYEYFDLSPDEVVLVEDTWNIYKPSATPESPDKDIPSLDEPSDKVLREFSELLCGTLNRWARLDHPAGSTPPFVFNAEFANLENVGVAMVALRKADREGLPRGSKVPGEMEAALERIGNAARETRGAFEYLRGVLHATNDAIYIVKPALRGQWTRTAALNAADEVFEAILSARERRPAS